MLGSRLEAIDADCERAAKIELAQLVENAKDSENNLRRPSPQAAEAVWLKLISRKENEFIQEIDKSLKGKSGEQSVAKTAPVDNEDIRHIEAIVGELLADDRYVDRMQDFYKEATPEVSEPEAGTAGGAKQAGFIDRTYRTGITAALLKARRNVLYELESHKPLEPEDASFSSQWKRYSTLSPWRLIWTIVLLSLTSYLIAFIIASDAFRGFLERMGWSVGTGL
ncbi:MAG TPA: hypothetical protein VFI43_09300 [Nitrosospira sp.]|nr:hypothetical protein [Nitrosospira sp.]